MMNNLNQSMKTATTIVSTSLSSRSGPSVEDWAKGTIVKLRNSSLSEKNELQRLNVELKNYLQNVKILENLNKRLIEEVERARELAIPKLMDKSKLDETLETVRLKLEDESNAAVKAQARIEESESICQHITQRLRFYQAEAEAHKQKIFVLQAQLNDMNGQRELLLRSAQVAADDIKREQERQLKSEKDLDNLRHSLKDNRSNNKKVEFEMQTILDELEFRKAIFLEERNDLMKRMSGMNAFTGPDLANFYKNELANAVRQIRADFHNLNEQQLAEYKDQRELELKVKVQRIEEERDFDKAIKAKLQASNDLEIQSSSQLRSSLDANRSEMGILTARNGELAKRLSHLESQLEQVRERNANLLEKKQAEIDALRSQNQTYVSELEYWDRVTRTKLEQEIQTYRSILNSQLRLMQASNNSSSKIGGGGSSSVIIDGGISGRGGAGGLSSSSTVVIDGATGNRDRSSSAGRGGFNSASSVIIGGNNRSESKVTTTTVTSVEDERQRNEVIPILREVFDYFDTDRSGKINSSELENVLRKLNVTMSRDAFAEVLREADRDLSRDIDFYEFCTIMMPVFTGKFNDDELWYAFKKFDTDNSGFITLNELRSILSKIGQFFSEREIANMISSVDTDRDGRLNFQEFTRLMRTPRY